MAWVIVREGKVVKSQALYLENLSGELARSKGGRVFRLPSTVGVTHSHWNPGVRTVNTTVVLLVIRKHVVKSESYKL